MEWYTTQSTVRPETLDVTSSRVYNYLRRNIEETEVEGVVFYTYDEMKVKKDDWQMYLKQEQMTADFENALCEQDAMYDERIGLIEDAICELDERIGEQA